MDSAAANASNEKMLLMRKLVLVTMVFAACAAWAQQPANVDPDAESQLVMLVNQERAKAGLPALHVDDRLTAAAREHSQLLLEHHLLSHQFGGEPSLPKRLAAKFVRADSDGENVAFDSTVEGAHEGLMLSPPHRENILSPKYDAIGIGIVRGDQYLWITQDFAHRTTNISEDKAADEVARAFENELRKPGRAPVTRINMSQMHSLACGLAGGKGLDFRPALQLPGARSAVAYNNAEPSHLPSSALRLRNNTDFNKFAVGVCFKDSPQNPAGTYWVLLVTF